MSKIGNYALEIQEQANELGYSTIQEALDDGYEVIEDVLTKVDSHDALAEIEKAHEAWLKEKNAALRTLRHAIEQLRSFGYQWAVEDADGLEGVAKFVEGCNDR